MADRDGQAAFDDAVLMAFADGELDAAAAAAVAAAAAADPSVAARVAMFRQTRTLAQAALPAEPVPDALAARIRALAAGAAPADPDPASGTPASGTVVPLRPRAAAPPPAAWRPAALAASLALAVGLGAGWLAGRQGNTGGPAGADVAAIDAALSRALDTLPAGGTAPGAGGATVRVIASFAGGDGAFCREAEVEGAAQVRVVVACRAGDGWALRLATVSPAAGGGFLPAGSAEAVEAWIAATGAGPVLSPEDEAAALARLR